MLPTKVKKKKRGSSDAQFTLKRVKLDTNAPHPLGMSLQYETTLSPPIQEALSKFREASEQELVRLRKEGMDSSAAINKLVEKMRSSEEDDVPPSSSSFTRQELELVMEIAGVNEEGATRALILRSELAKLRHDGFNHPEAINELSRRMKRLAGSKRRGTLSGERREGHKHRRRGSTPPSPTVSFTSLMDPLATTTTTTNTTTTSTATSTTPLQTQSTRKRLQDAIMMDGDQYTLLRKRPKYDLSDSDSSDDGEEDRYHFEVGEFSQDEKEGEDEGEYSSSSGGGRRRIEEGVKSPEDIIPLVAPFDYTASSSSDDDGFHILHHFHKDTTANDLEGDEGVDDVDISGWSESILFHPVTEEEGVEEEDDEEDEEEVDSDDSWHTTATTPTTATTTTTTTTTPTHHLPPLFPTSTHSSHSTNSTHSIPSPPTRTRTRVPHSTKRRDGTTPPPPHHSSTRTSLSQRSIT